VKETVHEVAARGFAAAADAYERARPDYPAAAVATIVEQLDLRPGRTLLELGAGTGKLTRQLVPSGARILALEPVAEMRAKLAETTPSAERIDGAAESIPLPAASVDAVVAAQAFHWFDAIRALSEIHRVLRPGGRLLLAWNKRDESVPWVKAMVDLFRDLEAREPKGSRRILESCALFEPFEEVAYRHAQQLTRQGVLDRMASISHVADADPATRAAMLAALESLLHADPGTAGLEHIELPYDTLVMWGGRRSIEPGDAGVVATVNVNAGGVPKPPVDGTMIRRLGLDGDGHANPDVHGGERAAVCLYAQEAIERVRADGHVAFPGSYGENLTLLGIDWARLGEGDRLELGEETGALLELTQTAAPCTTQSAWFREGRIARISAMVHPEDARWYARVLREGPVAPGMAVRRIAAR
jgi:MOSC domain-containing protein YiiM/ubiquinone/menaquinone biosynthesis C-methylase UbiE